MIISYFLTNEEYELVLENGNLVAGKFVRGMRPTFFRSMLDVSSDSFMVSLDYKN